MHFFRLFGQNFSILTPHKIRNAYLCILKKTGFIISLTKKVETTHSCSAIKRSRTLSDKARVRSFGKLKHYDLYIIIQKAKANVKLTGKMIPKK